ncbi:subtilisin-like protease C [Halorubrum lipolyticum DSM 21995]|uniref:Subtilisin-like protease C n=2 Tax=Halorubrum lipolyticum TaxID=368624 RepID=M0NZ82_9EURY|nr:subtilisin-like protease C [Halorubrum lipolyticum DSM 21995]
MATTVGLFGTLGAVGGASAADLVEVNVGVRNDAGRSAAKRAAAEVKREFAFDALTIRVAPAAAANLENNPNVRYVEENGTMEAFEQTTPYGVDITEADLAIDDGDTGAGVDVAVIDTGIDAQHETLQANLGEGWAAVDAACTTNCGGGGPGGGGGNDIDECLADWDDDNDHGTHCAGTAAAADDGTGVLGVAPEATLHAVKVLACDGSGSFDDIAAGIEWSADQGHDVQSMSLGADTESSVVADALGYAADRGVVMVAAAGNSGPCTDCVGFPARDDRVIAVSATDESDALADFSSTGPEVDIAAPGVDTLSTVPRDEYAEFSGTSMACPHVSGAAAQVIADGTTERDAVRTALLDAAEDVGLDESEQGSGRLNVADALGGDDGGNAAPEIDDLAVSEVETDDGDAEFDASWAVSDADADLDAVELTLVDDTAGATEDTASESVSGDAASGTTRLVAAGDDGSGNGYTVELVATDTEGASATDTATVTETEDGGDGGDGETPPAVDEFVVTDDSNPNWSRHAVEWAVSDADGDLATVTSEQLTDGGSVADAVSSGASGGSASGVDDLESRRTSVTEIRLTVVDDAGNETVETRSV